MRNVPRSVRDLLPSPQSPTIVYDGDCPFCSRYVAYYNLKKTLGSVTLLNAREHPELFRALSESGIDLDEGMVFIMNGQLYHGADAMNAMALMSSDSGAFNRVNAAIFRHTKLAKFLYPFLRSGRNVVLKLIGRKKLTETIK